MLGIICAMPIEFEEIKREMVVNSTKVISCTEYLVGTINGVLCVAAMGGVGKVNSAVCAQTMVLEFSPRVIINIGLAGGLDPHMNIGDIVVAKNTVQHDVDTSAIGDPVGFISTINIKNIPCCVESAEKILQYKNQFEGTNFFAGTIASGDQFVTEKSDLLTIRENFGAVACDMESASIAHVCYLNKVQFTSIRAISDNVTRDQSQIDYDKFRESIAKKPCKIINAAISSF